MSLCSLIFQYSQRKKHPVSYQLDWVWGTWLFMTPWTVAFQAPLSMGFSRQEYWSALPSPPLGDFHNPGVQSRSPAPPDRQGGSLPLVSSGKPENLSANIKKMKSILLHYVYPLLLSEQWPPLSFTRENKEQISVFTKTPTLKHPFPPDIQSASNHEFFTLDSSSLFICNIRLFFLAVLGLHCCSGFYPSCGKRELLSSCSVQASCCGGSSCGAQVLGCTGFSRCGAWA